MALNIEDYAIIGDCETAALVGRDGSIDWLCWPRFDSAACFANLLGEPENGRWRIWPIDPAAKVARRYRGHTMILDTLIETAEGFAIVTDFMPMKIRGTHLIRLVRGVRGSVRLRTELVIRFDYGSVAPWVHRDEEGSLIAVAGPDLLVLRASTPLHPDGLTHVGEFTVAEGESVEFTLSYGLSYQDAPRAIDPYKALEQTERTWLAWSKTFEHAGPWSEAAIRSLLTLRALIFQPSGGIVAAPTTSLPERLGGGRNWDYRFCWLRDATFTLLALMNAGYVNEADKWRKWLIRALGGEPSLVQILYGIAGERRAAERTLPWLSGYAASQPVRVGNAAADQLQLDIYGEVLDVFYHSRRAGLAPDGDDWALQIELLKHLEIVWEEPDEGIWEVRGGRRHFTYSKVMVWVAFDRAVKSVEEFGLEGPLDHWRALRQRIHDDVCRNGFDPEQGAFTQSYGVKELDASVLLIALVGFLPPEDPRVRSTVEAVERELMVDGLLRRYDPHAGVDGLPGGEGAFLACSFWLVDNLVLLGRTDDARRLFERLLALRNDLGLLAEEYDPLEKRFVGNFPQAFSHIALINSAYNLAHTYKPCEQRSGAKAPADAEGLLLPR
ncbi:glycoside hydrolase family 15 protein [Methylocapsa polymorpha]|uniref:Glycoside hydrolase family 15 protein n=1 Tax=Methylocapsa polymorpha TaxID=3080828 RepID=A0ABZ0HUP0_9HYPH|nr:glycoside hydrolase family 15 protein [Methylocapsa sp. RX1]